MPGIMIVRFEEFVRRDKAGDVAPIYVHPETEDAIWGETGPERHPPKNRPRAQVFTGYWHSKHFGRGSYPAMSPGSSGYILDPMEIVDSLNVERAKDMAEAGTLTFEDREAVLAYLEERIADIPEDSSVGRNLTVPYLKAGIEIVGRLPVVEAVPVPA